MAAQGIPASPGITEAQAADDDQAAGARVDDVVDALAKRRAGRHHLQRLYEPGLLATFELSELIPGTLRHQGRF